MAVTKKKISQRVSIDISTSSNLGVELVTSFFNLIKSRAREGNVKISRFGSFAIKSTPERMGRNPKTKDTYIIKERKKLGFIASKKIKEKLN